MSEAIEKKQSKVIPIKTSEKLKAKEDQPLSTIDLIKTVLEQRPADGFSVAEMKSRIGILNKIDDLHKDSTVLEVTNEEFSKISQLTKSFKWGMLDKFIIEFSDSVEA